MRVVTEGLIKGRELADAPVDQVRQFRALVDKDIRLPRSKEHLRPGGHAGEDRLASDDVDLAAARNAPRGPDDMLKLGLLHR